MVSWDVQLPDGKHTIGFEHNTMTGRRTIKIDGKVIRKTPWLFSLVGAEHFTFGKNDCNKAHVTITAQGLGYEYCLYIGNKPVDKYMESIKRTTKTWHFSLGSEEHFVVLDLDTLDIYADGEKVESAGEFADDGTETHFTLGSHPSYILTTSEETKRSKMSHYLYVDELEMDETLGGREK